MLRAVRCHAMLLRVTRAPACRQLLLDQQNSLRLMQADPSHGDAANPSAHSSFQNASARIKKTSVKGAEISPWDTGMAPARRSAHAAVKGTKLKKAAVTKQQQLEIPPALTALLQSVKQVRGTTFFTIYPFFAACALFSLSPPSLSPRPLSMPCTPSTLFSYLVSIGNPYLRFLSDAAHKAAQNSRRTARCRCCC